jgi:hypothetical protein
MRLVIENGKHYTKENFFMMLSEINPEHLDQYAGRFLKAIVEEAKISKDDI